ncbi:protein of unknown function [Oenococcus oeni]|uniref:Uncharacterized protein n=1 Tax=Oenococcus oeni TaxID=1247 RepID=A0AAQ2URZ5_OENOE|nr:hypothetical protein OENI_10036 [Oenococcus oeni]SYW06660.1 hypothetical protein OENI_330008 [Oenococcus oeni]SYW17441.1 hypothetical protein OENI_10109 [Oenococcus oeni]VDB98316.1 protein of unknown function [Oenococcus oeni]
MHKKTASLRLPWQIYRPCYVPNEIGDHVLRRSSIYRIKPVSIFTSFSQIDRPYQKVWVARLQGLRRLTSPVSRLFVAIALL